MEKSSFIEPVPGVRLRTLAIGEKTHMVEFHLQAGACLPEHSHPHEQTGYLVSGQLRLTVEGKQTEYTPGGSWSVAGDTIHSASVTKDSVVIEVFSPPREDYL